ncbi:MAG: metallophosphoesterase [Nitrososphaerales archaeon]
MRIVAFSDVHGDQSIIETIKQKAKECELILCCGDITPPHGMTIQSAKAIGRFDVQVLAIPGNFEMPDEMERVCTEMGWTNIHVKSIRVNDLLFFGCGGGNVGPFGTPYELSEEDFRVMLNKFSSKDRFVFLSHCPPKGSVDRTKSGLHVGSEAIAEFVRNTQPVYQFCGHIHEESGKESAIGKTRIYNVARQVKVFDIE